MPERIVHPFHQISRQIAEHCGILFQFTNRMRFETRIGIVKTFRKREIPLSRLHPFRFSRKTKAVAVQANRKSGKIGRTSIFVKDRARIFIDRVKPCPSAFSVRKEGRIVKCHIGNGETIAFAAGNLDGIHQGKKIPASRFVDVQEKIVIENDPHSRSFAFLGILIVRSKKNRI